MRCEGLKAGSPCGLEKGKRENKREKRGWQLASPRWGKVPWLWLHLCPWQQLGVQRAQQDHKALGTRLRRGAGATAACQHFQAAPEPSFPPALPWLWLSSLLSPACVSWLAQGSPAAIQLPSGCLLPREGFAASSPQLCTGIRLGKSPDPGGI